MTMSIMALPATTMPPRSESGRAEAARPRFRNGWEASFGLAASDRPACIDRRMASSAAFLAQELGQSMRPETRPAADFALALYSRIEQGDDPVIAGDWIIIRRSF